MPLLNQSLQFGDLLADVTRAPVRKVGGDFDLLKGDLIVARVNILRERYKEKQVYKRSNYRNGPSAEQSEGSLLGKEDRKKRAKPQPRFIMRSLAYFDICELVSVGELRDSVENVKEDCEN